MKVPLRSKSRNEDSPLITRPQNQSHCHSMEERRRMIVEGFERGWEVIQKGITRLIQDLPNPNFTPEEYITIYTTVYNMCTAKPPFDYSLQLHDRYKKTIQEYISSRVLPSLREKHDELLVEELVRTWLNHKLLVRWLTRFFNYLDRRFIPNKGLPTLTVAGFTFFHDMVYGEIGDQVTNVVISMIDQEREGEQIDQVLIKNVLDIYVEMRKVSIGFYENEFEAALLKSTAEYYSRKAANWIMVDSYSEYMIKVSECLKQEVERASRYFDSSSEPKLLEIVEQELLTAYRDLLHEKKHSDDITLPAKKQI